MTNTVPYWTFTVVFSSLKAGFHCPMSVFHYLVLVFHCHLHIEMLKEKNVFQEITDAFKNTYYNICSERKGLCDYIIFSFLCWLVIT